MECTNPSVEDLSRPGWGSAYGLCFGTPLVCLVVGANFMELLMWMGAATTYAGAVVPAGGVCAVDANAYDELAGIAAGARGLAWGGLVLDVLLLGIADRTRARTIWEVFFLRALVGLLAAALHTSLAPDDLASTHAWLTGGLKLMKACLAIGQTMYILGYSRSSEVALRPPPPYPAVGCDGGGGHAYAAPASQRPAAHLDAVRGGAGGDPTVWRTHDGQDTAARGGGGRSVQWTPYPVGGGFLGSPTAPAPAPAAAPTAVHAHGHAHADAKLATPPHRPNLLAKHAHAPPWGTRGHESPWGRPGSAHSFAASGRGRYTNYKPRYKDEVDPRYAPPPARTAPHDSSSPFAGSPQAVNAGGTGGGGAASTSPVAYSSSSRAHANVPLPAPYPSGDHCDPRPTNADVMPADVRYADHEKEKGGGGVDGDAALPSSPWLRNVCRPPPLDTPEADDPLPFLPQSPRGRRGGRASAADDHAAGRGPGGEVDALVPPKGGDGPGGTGDGGAMHDTTTRRERRQRVTGPSGTPTPARLPPPVAALVPHSAWGVQEGRVALDAAPQTPHPAEHAARPPPPPGADRGFASAVQAAVAHLPQTGDVEPVTSLSGARGSARASVGPADAGADADALVIDLCLDLPGDVLQQALRDTPARQTRQRVGFHSTAANDA